MTKSAESLRWEAHDEICSWHGDGCNGRDKSHRMFDLAIAAKAAEVAEEIRESVDAYYCHLSLMDDDADDEIAGTVLREVLKLCRAQIARYRAEVERLNR